MSEADPMPLSPEQPLCNRPRGLPGRIVRLDGDPGHDPVIRRLYELGFDEGAPVELTHRGPLGGDPLAVRVGQMTVALRRAEAARILVRG